MKNLPGRLAELGRLVREFMFGAAMSWVMPPHTMKRRDVLERMFMLMTVGDLMGCSLLPPPGGLRFIPFLVPQILYWHRRMALWGKELEGVDLRHIGH